MCYKCTWYFLAKSESSEFASTQFAVQVQARSSIVVNLASVLNAQQVFQSTFNALINDDSFIKVNIEKYQSVLEHALSKVDYSIGTGFIYFLVV